MDELKQNEKQQHESEIVSHSNHLVNSKRYSEYVSKLELFIRKAQQSDFVRMQIKNLSQDNMIDIYNKKVGSSGLENIGNTCFMNAILQCLRHTILLNGYLFGHQIQDVLIRNLEIQSISNAQIALLINYIKVVSTLWENDGGVLAPLSFKAIFCHVYKQFDGYDHHDAHECLVTLLSSFHETLSRNVKYKITGEVINDLDQQIKKAHEDWATYYKNRHSAILDIFSGQLQTKIVCQNCQKTTHKYDPVMALDLPLPNKSSQTSQMSYTIYECLNNYVEPEQLTLDNVCYCEHCKTRSCAYRVISLWTLPNVLIIKLSRFHYSVINSTYRMNKISDFIHYPLTDLDLSKHVSSPLDERTKYDLYGVVCHQGTPEFGHYYAYCYHPLKGQWFSYNDEQVKPIDNKESIITSSAYILFYQKKV
jgi:ubiquitin carboxyl-terminal hydrolase 8